MADMNVNVQAVLTDISTDQSHYARHSDLFAFRHQSQTNVVVPHSTGENIVVEFRYVVVVVVVFTSFFSFSSFITSHHHPRRRCRSSSSSTAVVVDGGCLSSLSTTAVVVVGRRHRRRPSSSTVVVGRRRSSSYSFCFTCFETPVGTILFHRCHVSVQRPSVADWGDDVSARCTVCPIVR